MACNSPRPSIFKVMIEVHALMQFAANVYDEPADGIEKRYQYDGLQLTMSALDIE